MKTVIILALAAVALAQSMDPVPILNEEVEMNRDGSYKFSYATGDGIQREESGIQKQIGEEMGQATQGRVTYTAPDGQRITLSYVADEDGFQPTGSHLPTPPPAPEHVVKILDDLRRQGKL